MYHHTIIGETYIIIMGLYVCSVYVRKLDLINVCQTSRERGKGRFSLHYINNAQTFHLRILRGRNMVTHTTVHHTHTHTDWWAALLAVDSNYRGLQQSDQQTNIYTTGEGLTQQTWGWNPGSHHTLSFKRDEGNQKRKENSKYIYKFDGRHNTLSTFPHSRRGGGKE